MVKHFKERAVVLVFVFLTVLAPVSVCPRALTTVNKEAQPRLEDLKDGRWGGDLVYKLFFGRLHSGPSFPPEAPFPPHPLGIKSPSISVGPKPIHPSQPSPSETQPNRLDQPFRPIT
ncbi:hypothetical protein Nepgr_021738 [Nepenthes gracilis]|uniref:Uncharacterized protein n=1 Tax=Nepenthes gracilis TaxID=150966 RepID=A0AAD3SZF4_NEPGR|nr:hypothetical protein Nepgr_021738 [Nepenthes gracilis]